MDLPDYAIEATGLYKTYAATRTTPAKTALNGVDLKVPRGSIFGLLGPNGAGKSTFINILAGLVRKSAGTVSIWGRNIDQRPWDARACIGVVAQEIVADVFFTPRESLEVQAGLYGCRGASGGSMEILSALGLGDKQRRLCAPAVRRDEATADGGQGHGSQSAGVDSRRAHRGGRCRVAPATLELCRRLPQRSGEGADARSS